MLQHHDVCYNSADRHMDWIRWSQTHLVLQRPLSKAVRAWLSTNLNYIQSTAYVTSRRFCSFCCFPGVTCCSIVALQLVHTTPPSQPLDEQSRYLPPPRRNMMWRSSLCWVDILCSILCRLYLDKLSPDSNHLFILTCATSNAWLFCSTRAGPGIY